MTDAQENNAEKDKVSLSSYDEAWPAKAFSEIDLIKQIECENKFIIDIQHIGSTAIPGLKAKPIIDIYVGVSSIQAAQDLITPVKAMGYQYWDENPNPKKMFFVKGMPPYGSGRTHHIHVVEHHSDYWRARIAFRDFLRAHKKYADEYEQLKLKLQRDDPLDREAYTDGKYAFVQKILKLAGYEGAGDR